MGGLFAELAVDTLGTGGSVDDGAIIRTIVVFSFWFCLPSSPFAFFSSGRLGRSFFLAVRMAICLSKLVRISTVGKSYLSSFMCWASSSACSL
jgi:hypothetical protein